MHWCSIWYTLVASGRFIRTEWFGSYKVCQTKVKFEMLAKKAELKLPLTLGPTDIVPIVAKSWDSSFGRVEHNKKAINERGWLLCNKALLKNPEVLRTRTDTQGTHLFADNDPGARMTTQSLQLNTETGKTKLLICLTSFIKSPSTQLLQFGVVKNELERPKMSGRSLIAQSALLLASYLEMTWLGCIRKVSWSINWLYKLIKKGN